MLIYDEYFMKPCAVTSRKMEKNCLEYFKLMQNMQNVMMYDEVVMVFYGVDYCKIDVSYYVLKGDINCVAPAYCIAKNCDLCSPKRTFQVYKALLFPLDVPVTVN